MLGHQTGFGTCDVNRSFTDTKQYIGMMKGLTPAVLTHLILASGA